TPALLYVVCLYAKTTQAGARMIARTGAVLYVDARPTGAAFRCLPDRTGDVNWLTIQSVTSLPMIGPVLRACPNQHSHLSSTVPAKSPPVTRRLNWSKPPGMSSAGHGPRTVKQSARSG